MTPTKVIRTLASVVHALAESDTDVSVAAIIEAMEEACFVYCEGDHQKAKKLFVAVQKEVYDQLVAGSPESREFYEAQTNGKFA